MFVEIIRNSDSRYFSLAMGGFKDDYCILKREAKSGKPTFALAYDQGGRQFPVIVAGLADIPLGAIRQKMSDILRGHRFVRKHNLAYRSEWELLRLGEQTRPAEVDELDRIRSHVRYDWAIGQIMAGKAPKTEEEMDMLRYLGPETLRRLARGLLPREVSDA